MRTAESRDIMVARVQAAFEKHRTFEDWREVEPKTGHIQVLVEKPVTKETYLAALYEVCAAGEPIGRADGLLVGRRVAEDAPVPDGKRLTAGRGKSA
ncbi:MAG: hypothetical protein JWQ89_2243 [Devosia sp.]|uniref:hypothetical protein n=1 Tax=Devosia sp. TaxID=1871048 RepID=UPI0026077CC0|nr:hypothetical protein [Devosia sp.]MDB5540516.1 hypothetical protein [Devosia sp.]